MQEKDYVFCLKCGHDFFTKSDHPRCKCGSLRVVLHSQVSAKTDVLFLAQRVAENEKDITHLEEEILRINEILKSFKKIFKDYDMV